MISMSSMRFVRINGWAALFSVLFTFTVIGLLIYFFWKIIAFIFIFLIGLIFIGALSRKMNRDMLSGRVKQKKKKDNVIEVQEYKVE